MSPIKKNIMNKSKIKIFIWGFFLCLTIWQCTKETTTINNVSVEKFVQTIATFGTNIDFNNLANYAKQTIPTYITKDNTTTNPITNEKATIGRVLFYDKNLSINNTLACASCHLQNFAFGDTAVVSSGVLGGVTLRHSMRLINPRFSVEKKFFWDKDAITLEDQTTDPIKSHAELGFSGDNNRPTFNAFLTKLNLIGYYKEMFNFVYKDTIVTEARIKECLAQFIRSIQSFDSKYDIGRAQVPNDNTNFPNFTASENNGKNLFLAAPTFNASGVRTGGGFGCNGCHNAPEFDIDPNSRNNGIIGIANTQTGIDITVTKAPSLRDIVNSNGNLNSPLMHTAGIKDLMALIGHYGKINKAPGNTNLDPKLMPGGIGQNLNLTATETMDIIAFLKTLTGKNVYTDVKWSNPFLVK